MNLQHYRAGPMRIKKGIRFALGFVLAAFLFDGTANAIIVDPINVETLSKASSGVVSHDIQGTVTTTDDVAVRNVKVTAVPVPPAAILFGSALLGIGFLSRRRRKKKQKNSVSTVA